MCTSKTIHTEDQGVKITGTLLLLWHLICGAGILMTVRVQHFITMIVPVNLIQVDLLIKETKKISVRL